MTNAGGRTRSDIVERGHKQHKSNAGTMPNRPVNPDNGLGGRFLDPGTPKGFVPKDETLAMKLAAVICPSRYTSMHENMGIIIRSSAIATRTRLILGRTKVSQEA
jgi:hypothetical protein